MKKNSKAISKPPQRAAEVPVTRVMLYGVRDELKSDIRSLEHLMNSRFEGMDSRFEKQTAEIHRIGLLVEEQNAKNDIVLEGLSNLFHRQERLENQVGDFGKIFPK